MCAGSLMSGCSFDVTCFSIHGELGADVVKFGAHNVSFGMLVAPNLAPWGPSSVAGGLGRTQKEIGGPGLDFFRFWKDFGVAIWTFLANFGTTIVFFGMRVCRSRFLKILGSESGCLGLQNQAFGEEGIAKTSFSLMLGLCRFWCHFYMVFDDFGSNFDDFWCRLETS